MEVTLSLLTQMKNEYPNCHLHQNVIVRKDSDKFNVVQQLDGILHGHLTAPTFALVVEAKTSIHPNHLDEVLERVTLFTGYVSKAHMYNFSTGWGPDLPLSSFTHFSNVQRVIPCLAGRRFPDILINRGLDRGIIPVFPSGARYVAKGLELLRKIA